MTLANIEHYVDAHFVACMYYKMLVILEVYFLF